MENIRTLREELVASATYDEACKKYPRFEDLWMGWTWRLVRDPEIDAVQVPNTTPQAYLVKTWDFSGDHDLPASVTFLYTYDDSEVQILALRIVEAPTKSELP